MQTLTKLKLGWIGTGRMGYEMAARLAKGGCDISVWNRTAAKAQPLAEHGAKVARMIPDLAKCDIVFCMVSTWDDVKEVIGKLLSLVERYPPLVDGAFVIIAWVAIKLFAEYLHTEGYLALEIPKFFSLGLIVVIFAVSYLYARRQEGARR